MSDEITRQASITAKCLSSLAKLVAETGDHAVALQLQGFAGFVQSVGQNGVDRHPGSLVERAARNE